MHDEKELRRLANRKVGEMCSHIRWTSAARKLFDPSKLPGEMLQAFLGAGLYVDGIRLMAAALLPRRAVWWACLCTRHSLGTVNPDDPATRADHAALQATVRWVVEPTDRYAKPLPGVVRAIPKATPARCTASAAILAGTIPQAGGWLLRSATPKGASLTSAAVLLAAARASTEDAGYWYRQYLLIGLDVDAERLVWREHAERVVSLMGVPKPAGA